LIYIFGLVGDQGSTFGVIIKGRAIVYESKTKPEQENVDKKEHMKADTFRHYWDYLEQRDFSKKFKRLAHESTSAERIASVVLNKSKRFESSVLSYNGQLTTGRSFSMRSIEMIIDNVLNQPEDCIRGYEHEYDYTFEEKLLLLNHNVNVKSYFNKGLPTHKKFRELKKEDFISKIALAIDQPAEHTIIAAEDVHILTIKTEDFLSFFEFVPNFRERKEFIRTALPSLDPKLAMKLCAQLEERSFVNFENVYNKGDYSDAIYFIKKGCVQLIVDNKEEKTRKELGYPINIHDKENKAPKPREMFVVCNLTDGHVFGENDVMLRRGRKYRAMCSSDHLITYVLKREVYYDVFMSYFPELSGLFEATIQNKISFRKQYEDLKKQIVDEDNKMAISEPRNKPFKIVNVRMMNNVEAKYRNIKIDQSELVYETKPVYILEERTKASRVTPSMAAVARFDINSIEVTSLLYQPKTLKSNKEELIETYPDPPKKSQQHAESTFQLVKTKLFRQNQYYLKERTSFGLSSFAKRIARKVEKQHVLDSIEQEQSPLCVPPIQVLPVTEEPIQNEQTSPEISKGGAKYLSSMLQLPDLHATPRPCGDITLATTNTKTPSDTQNTSSSPNGVDTFTTAQKVIKINSGFITEREEDSQLLPKKNSLTSLDLEYNNANNSTSSNKSPGENNSSPETQVRAKEIKSLPCLSYGNVSPVRSVRSRIQLPQVARSLEPGQFLNRSKLFLMNRGKYEPRALLPEINATKKSNRIKANSFATISLELPEGLYKDEARRNSNCIA